MMTPPAPLSKGEKRIKCTVYGVRCTVFLMRDDEFLIRRRLFLGLSLALKSRIVSTLAGKWVENEPMGGEKKPTSGSVGADPTLMERKK